MNRLYYAFFFLLLCTSSGFAQSSLEQYYEQIKQYEPNAEFPFGRINPNAPAEVKQFEFMVGICECQDSVRTPDGSWLGYPSIWEARYFLNGYAIQDKSFNPRSPTTNLRLYDPNSGTWKVTYMTSQTGYFTGVWEGKRDEDEFVLTQEQTTSQGQKVISKLTFFNISDDGYEWKSESVSADGSTRIGWKKKCNKRKN